MQTYEPSSSLGTVTESNSIMQPFIRLKKCLIGYTLILFADADLAARYSRNIYSYRDLPLGMLMFTVLSLAVIATLSVCDLEYLRASRVGS